MPSVPYLTAGDVQGRIDWLAMTEALAAGHRGPRPVAGDLFVTRGSDTLQARAAWVEGLGAAVKSFTVLAGNPARGLPSVQGALVLYAADTGAVEAVIDSALVTRWKTAADSLLGARLLARPDSQRLLILGAGEVAASLIDAYRAGFPGIGVALWNRSLDRTSALAARTGATVAADLPAAVAAADIVATATMSPTPVVHGDWLTPGQHLDLIGAYRPDMREADDTALRRARLFVDSRTSAAHVGEIADPLARGVITEADILGDLYDLVAGGVGRRDAAEITLYKNAGGAHLDLMVGRAILAAWRGGKGRE